jgi:hypothetical protein
MRSPVGATLKPPKPPWKLVSLRGVPPVTGIAQMASSPPLFDWK